MTMNRSHLLFCAGVCLVAAACFAFPAVLVLYGLLLLPLFIAGLIREPSLSGLADSWPLLAMIVFGAAGLFGVVRVLVLLCRRPHAHRRWLTFAALACGVAAVLVDVHSNFEHETPTPFMLWLLIVYLPLACTLLLVFLARRPLFD